MSDSSTTEEKPENTVTLTINDQEITVEKGTNVLVSSHVLHEVQSLTPRIVLIHRGRLLAQGSVRDVRQLL